jgi:hypothetical protein
MLDKLNRRGAIATMLATALLVGHPVGWASGLMENDGKRDSFPLSTYPMFASKVPAVYGLHHIIATGPGVDTVRVPKRYWTHGGMNQARGQLERAAREHRGVEKPKSRLQKFCEVAARRVGRLRGNTRTRFDGTRQIEVVYSRYHLKNYFLGLGTAPQSQVVRFTCPIERTPFEVQSHKGER